MFYNLKSIESMHPLFQAIENCRGIDQDPEHHPEGDVFIHSLQVLYIAIRESDNLDLIFAAMLHDVGKKIGSHGHEQYSCILLKDKISEKTEWLIREHMRIRLFLSGEMRKVNKVKYLYTHHWFPELVILRRWDVMGRNPVWKPNYDRVEIVERLIRKENN